jgi:uncharacterized membrane protein
MSGQPGSGAELVHDNGRIGWLRDGRAQALVAGRSWELVVWAAMAVWTVVLYAIVRAGFLSFRVGRFDLGNMVQAVWSTGQGRPLEVTHGATGEQMLRLGGHVDPFLALLAPVWLMWPSPLALALAQVAVVALGALPVFWLARLHVGSEGLAGVLALAYLAYPWVATSAAAAIHPVTFAITFLLFCVWFLETGRLWLFAVFAALVMATGELMGLPIAGLGVWYAFAHGRRRAGAAIAAAGLAWTFLAVYLVVPAVQGGGSIFYGFYEEAGGSPEGVLRTLVSDPLTIARLLAESHDVVYVVWLGLPLLFLFLLSPGLAAIAVPQLLANGLSDFRSMTDPRYHSVAAIVPFLVAATVLGIARLPARRRGVAAAAVLVCSATLALVVGPWPRAVGATPLGGRETPSAARVTALREAVALVPAGAPVMTTNAAGAYLSARRYVYSVPVSGRAEWAVVDLGDPWVVTEGSPILTRDPEVVAGVADELRRDAGWNLVLEREDVLVFRRLVP